MPAQPDLTRDLPPEVMLEIVKAMPHRCQLRFRLLCQYSNGLFQVSPSPSLLQRDARTALLKRELGRILQDMSEFYDMYGCIGADLYPSFLVRDEILLDMPFRLSRCDKFLSYLTSVLLLHPDRQVLELALSVAINVSVEPKNGLGCHVLKNQRVMDRMFAIIEQHTTPSAGDCELAELAVLLIGNIHEHREHVRTCPYNTGPGEQPDKPIPPRVLQCCKQAVNKFLREHPENEDAQFAAYVWNSV